MAKYSMLRGFRKRLEGRGASLPINATNAGAVPLRCAMSKVGRGDEVIVAELAGLWRFKRILNYCTC